MADAEDDPLVALRDARTRFLAAFPAQCDSIEQLAFDAAADRSLPQRAAAHHQVHRIAGMAGTIGFPTLSSRAGELEALLSAEGPYDAELARDMVRAMRDAFTNDLAWPPQWAADAPRAETSLTVLVVDDDPDQRAIIAAYLRGAGHQVQELDAGDGVLDHVRNHRPSVILLDVELPGLDGYSVCRLLKADPHLAAIPVVILTTRQALNDRMTGLTLGADEFLGKPLDMRELLLRVQRAAERTAPPLDAMQPSDTLPYATFASAARGPLSVGPAAVALVRFGPGASVDAVKAFRHEVRRRDIVGRYNDHHLVLLLPGMTAAAARDRLRDIITGLREAGHPGLAAGVAGSAAGTTTIESLVAEADEALAQARVNGEVAAIRSGREPGEKAARARHVLLADDDPEVARIVDAHMRAEGFRTTVVFDGQLAVEAVERERPDLLVLDLMMPKMTGFDVLHRLRALADRPRTIVLSARGREEDVTRAFDLGADDYVMKPFSPQELRARIVRLLR